MKKIPIYIGMMLFILCLSQHAIAGEIHEASKNGDLVKINKLLDKDPGLINRGDENGVTPLHWAAIRGRKIAVELLIARGADVNAKKKGGSTPLHWASTVKISEILIKKGADVNAKNQYDGTPLHWAIHTNNPDKMMLLLSKGANVDAKDNKGRTPLHWAAMFNFKDGVLPLVAKGAKINERDKKGKTPLGIALEKGNKEVAKILEDQGAER